MLILPVAYLLQSRLGGNQSISHRLISVPRRFSTNLINTPLENIRKNKFNNDVFTKCIINVSVKCENKMVL